MALITCKECKKQISSKAKKCPHCGAPLSRTQKVGFGGCLLIIAIIIIFGAIIDNFTSSNTTPIKTNKTKKDIKKLNVYKDYKILRKLDKLSKHNIKGKSLIRKIVIKEDLNNSTISNILKHAKYVTENDYNIKYIKQKEYRGLNDNKFWNIWIWAYNSEAEAKSKKGLAFADLHYVYIPGQNKWEYKISIDDNWKKEVYSSKYKPPNE